MNRIGAVILAAGESSRLGEPKQLLEWRGRPLVVRTAEAVRAAGACDVVVVVGANAERVREVLAGVSVRVVKNADWREGMGASIRAGIGALESVDAALIALCDQPFFSEQVAARLIETWMRCGGIVAARYANRLGAPAVFAKEYFDSLKALAGDEGARRILAANASQVTAIDLPELEIDVDTPRDWDNARRKLIG